MRGASMRATRATGYHPWLRRALLTLIGSELMLAPAVAVGWFKRAPWSGPHRTPSAERPEPALPAALPTRVREAS